MGNQKGTKTRLLINFGVISFFCDSTDFVNFTSNRLTCTDLNSGWIRRRCMPVEADLRFLADIVSPQHNLPCFQKLFYVVQILVQHSWLLCLKRWFYWPLQFVRGCKSWSNLCVDSHIHKSLAVATFHKKTQNRTYHLHFNEYLDTCMNDDYKKSSNISLYGMNHI